ncbi:MAG: hypothetical protein HUJ63_10485, partial [Enterococcus sp.]|nr:hypothetical protein [Enterococcus sp.]
MTNFKFPQVDEPYEPTKGLWGKYFSYFTADKAVRSDFFNYTFQPGERISFFVFYYMTIPGEGNINIPTLMFSEDTKLTLCAPDFTNVNIKLCDGFTKDAQKDIIKFAWPDAKEMSILTMLDNFSGHRFDLASLLSSDALFSIIDSQINEDVYADGANGISHVTFSEDLKAPNGNIVKAGTKIYDPYYLLSLKLPDTNTNEMPTLNVYAADYLHLQFQGTDGVEVS